MNIKNLFLLALVLLAHTLNARIFFVGSNPHLSVFAFPQDIFLTPSGFIYYYTTYQKDPWWGDIDEPTLRPNNTYISTGENIDEGVNGSSFEHKGFYNLFKNHIGFGHEISDKARTRFDFRYSIFSMRNRASGIFAGTDSVSFDYKEGHSINDLHLRSILAIMIRDVPVGFNISLGSEFTREPDLEFDFTRNGVPYSSNRLIWAWSTTRGRNIFEVSEPEGEAEFQSRYAMGPLFKLDVQAATTLPKLKFGGRFRFRYGTLDQYSWQSNPNTTTELDSNFVGEYVKSDAKKIRNITGRLYGNYNWVKREKYKFNTLVLTRYTKVDSTGVLPENLDVTTGRLEESRTFVLQINPNFNIYPWKHKTCYIDMALLCNYSHMSYDFLMTRYVDGGQREDYVPTSVRYPYTEDYSWYEYSYAKQNFFELALDVNSVLPIFGSKNQNVALGVTLLLWRRFLWMNKYHGGYPNDPAIFEVQNIRKNFDMETWLNTALNIIYRRGAYVFRFDIGQPLIYTLTPRTRITDANGDKVLYELKKESMWVSQSGVQLGLFVSTSLKNIFRRRSSQEQMQ